MGTAANGSWRTTREDSVVAAQSRMLWSFTAPRAAADDAAMPDVSVIVPTFNRPELLERALESLAAQSLERGRFEVVVVNDCGLDPSAVVEHFADRLDILLVSTAENSGLAASRNAGIAASSGRYLSFLDDDDELYPEHLALLLDQAERLGGRTIVYSDAIKLVEDPSGQPLMRHMLLAPATFSYDRLLLNNYIHAMSPLVPRVALEELGGFDAQLRALEDWELWLRLGASFDFHHVLRVTADYRVREGSVNNTTRELPLHVRCTEAVYERYPAEPGSRLARDRAAYLEQHRQVAGQHAFAMSVAIVGATDAASLRAAIDESRTAHGIDRVELLAYVESPSPEAAAELRTLEAEHDGRLTLVTGEPLASDAAFAVLERKAAGLRIERMLADPPSDSAPSADAVDTDDYCITSGYRIRPVPEYYADTPTNITWQPDVYPEARRIAGIVGASTIIDIGSGNGDKLAALHPEFAIVGLDIGVNLDHVRGAHPQGTWLEHDLEHPGPLPLDAELLADSVVICADVIEHLMQPEHLLAKLVDAFERGAAAVLLSTPERDRTWGPNHAGPPPNPCHVREWTLDELGALLDRAGFGHGDLELTRSNDAESRMATSLAILYRDEQVEQVVRAVRDARRAAA
jgi:hypothetical protein